MKAWHRYLFRITQARIEWQMPLHFSIIVYTITHMKLTYDPEKDARNLALRGISFEEAVNFDFSDALIWQDDRENYQEIRFCALGCIGNRLHALVFTYRHETIRVISLRKANKREVKCYENKTRNG